MIVTVAGHAGAANHALFTYMLAQLRAGAGRKVLLLDADPGHAQHPAAASGVPIRVLAGRRLQDEIAEVAPRYQDLMIDIDLATARESRSALIAAGLLIVPLEPGHADVDADYGLVARINSARMFNPGLRVVFVVLDAGGGTSSPEQMAALRKLVAHVMAARLAATVIHAPGVNPPSAQEMASLYREVFAA